MHGNAIRRILPLGAILAAGMHAHCALAQCSDALPDVLVEPEADGIAYSGEELRFSVKAAAANRPVTRITVSVDSTEVVRLEGNDIPAPSGDGRIRLKYSYSVGSQKPGTIRLPPSGTPTVRVAATDATGSCGQGQSALTTRSPEAFAVVVGINEYPQAQSSLKYARKDAEAVAQHLIDNFDGLDPENVVLLTDPVPQGEPVVLPDNRGPATRKAIMRALGNVARRVDRAGAIIFYYSGHGFATGAAGYRPLPFLMTHDASLEYDSEMLSISEIVDLIDGVKVERAVLIIDACFSDRIVIGRANPDESLRSGRAFGPITVIDGIARFVDNKSVYVMTSSSGDQLSYELKELKHGAFTYYLLNPDDEAVPSGDLTIFNAYKAAESTVPEKVRDAVGKLQEPKHWIFGPAERMIWKRAHHP